MSSIITHSLEITHCISTKSIRSNSFASQNGALTFEMTGIVCPLESRGVMVGVSVCSVAMHGCTTVGKRDCGEALDLRQSETQSPYRLNRQSDYWLGAHSLLCGAVCMSASILPNAALIKNEMPKTMKPGLTVSVSLLFSRRLLLS